MQKILESLTPLERKVLPKIRQNMTFSALLKETGLSNIEVMRALGWLEGKKIIAIRKDAQERIELDVNGERYLKHGLPEMRFLAAIEKEPLPLEAIRAKADLDGNESSIALGVLKQRNAIILGKSILLTSAGKELLKKKSPEKHFLEGLPREVSSLQPEEAKLYQAFKMRRQIVKTLLVKEMYLHLTSLGHQMQKQKFEHELLEKVTTALIKEGGWKGKKFRRYDLRAEVPRVYPGRRHFTQEAADYIRKIWLDMGFTEISGNLVQTSFWNFDALFTPQDHSAREMQDTFFLKHPAQGMLPNAQLVGKIKSVHESGGSTGSKGWQYSWSTEDAKKNVLRTHTTVLTAKLLAALKTSEMPAKFFSVGRCFRNETLDWKHLFEFDQSEGIVVDEHANFRHLLGYLKEFFQKMGFSKVRFRPGYFPYTTLSTEVEVFHPYRKKWVELGGAGLARPEVVVPLLGKDIPVLMWGLGVGRIIGDYYNLKDIREMYQNDLKQLREMKLWIK